MEDNTKQPTENIINVHPSNAKAVKDFFDKNVVPSAESESVPSAVKYLETCGIYDIALYDPRGLSVEHEIQLSKLMEQFAYLCVEQARKEWEKEKVELSDKVKPHAKFIKLKFFFGNTMHGVLNEYQVVESDNPFFIHKIVAIQNIDKKQYVGWSYENKEDLCNTIDEFKIKHKIGEIEFISKNS